MIVDDIVLLISAGNGGDGSISFRREKYVPKGGPDGGNGGKGGDVYFIGTNRIQALSPFKANPHIEAENGGHGRGRKMHGKKGKDLHVPIPIGTLVTNTQTKKQFEILRVNQKVKVATGGEGGLGNWEFRSATNQTPRFAERGKPGQKVTLHCNLRFIADAGLIGLPNAGKSSLVNALTNAHLKTGAYAFTTLEANLARLGEYIIADIPGLIEGAHKGKGLGDKFLKHVGKTKLLVHCIDCTNENLAQNYQTIQKEITAFDPTLKNKKEIIVLTKIDLLDRHELSRKIKEVASLGLPTFTVSIADEVLIERFKQDVIEQLASYNT